MLVLKARKKHGKQYIDDLRKAEINKRFRGFPLIKNLNCLEGCNKCRDICPSNAINNDCSIDLGKCIFCGDCQNICSMKKIEFTNFHKLGSDRRDKLIIKQGMTFEEFYSNSIEFRKDIKSLFGKSLKLRQVSAAGCNGCEMELNASGNVNFDMGRYGIDFVASPRHADGIVITGPVSENMAGALYDAYMCTPDPKIVILAGSCAISSGVFHESKALNREFIDNIKIDLFIPGCPVHPLTIINSIMDFLGYKK